MVEEKQFLMRFPPDVAHKVREIVSTGENTSGLGIEFSEDGRHATVHCDGKVMAGKLVDLPCIIESHKTVDKKILYKTGDLSQMMVCTHDAESSQVEQLSDLRNLSSSKRKEVMKEFQWNHGIAPSLKNVRKRRFRKTAPKKYIDSPEIEKEVRRLLREDLQASDVHFEVITEEDKGDEQSVMSGLPSPRDEDDLAEILQATSSESDDD